MHNEYVRELYLNDQTNSWTLPEWKGDGQPTVWNADKSFLSTLGLVVKDNIQNNRLVNENVSQAYSILGKPNSRDKYAFKPEVVINPNPDYRAFNPSWSQTVHIDGRDVVGKLRPSNVTCIVQGMLDISGVHSETINGELAFNTFVIEFDSTRLFDVATTAILAHSIASRGSFMRSFVYIISGTLTKLTDYALNVRVRCEFERQNPEMRGYEQHFMHLRLSCILVGGGDV